MALALVGDDLYAATGSSGGIFASRVWRKIEPEITMIYAREDLRHTSGGGTTCWAANR